MKFGEYYKKHKIKAWSTQYIEYKTLKKIITDLILSEVKTTDNINNKSKNKQFERLNDDEEDVILRPICVEIELSKISKSSSFAICREETTDDDYEEDDELELKQNTNERTANNNAPTQKTTFDLNHLLSFIQQSIQLKLTPTSKQNSNTHQIIKLQECEKKFLMQLQRDLNKVSAFYAEQCRLFINNTNELLQRLKLYVEHQKQSQMNGKQERQKVIKLFHIMYHAIVHKLCNYRRLNLIAIYKICKKHDKRSCFKHLQRIIEEQNINSNFSDLIAEPLEKQLLQRLENAYAKYLYPNIQQKKCFQKSKQSKKGDAITELRTVVSKDVHTIPHLMQVFDDHGTIGQLSMINKYQRKQRQQEICRLGFYSGCSLTMFCVCLILFAIANMYDYKTNDDKTIDFWSSQITWRSWYIFRASALISLYMWLWATDLHCLQRMRFNHQMIFEADPRKIHKAHEMFTTAALCTCVTMFMTLGYILSFLFSYDTRTDNETLVNKIPGYTFALLLFAFWLCFVICPIKKSLISSRNFLFKSIGRQITAPFSKVTFNDFFIADQWCSLFTIVVDIAFSVCYISTGEFLHSDHTQANICDGSTVTMIINLFKFYPYWIRFAQCIRRFYDSKLENKTHLVNAMKYASAILTVICAAFYEHYGSQTLLILRLIFAIGSTLYAYTWDIVKDWGLMKILPNSRNKENKKRYWIFLRKDLNFSPLTYYTVMILNFIFRISWAIALFPHSFHISIDMHYINLALASIEIIRRCIWNIFRLENEHLNNCGQFRVL